jgi:hypothetical protein
MNNAKRRRRIQQSERRTQRETKLKNTETKNNTKRRKSTKSDEDKEHIEILWRRIQGESKEKKNIVKVPASD